MAGRPAFYRAGPLSHHEDRPMREGFDAVHIHPDDGMDHDIVGTCWCRPKVEIAENRITIVHKHFDGIAEHVTIKPAHQRRVHEKV